MRRVRHLWFLLAATTLAFETPRRVQLRARGGHTARSDRRVRPQRLVAMSSTASPSGEDIVGWGIVGLGDVCAVKAGPAFVKAEGSRLVAVMRRTPGAAEEWARQKVPGGGCTGYDNLDAFLSDPLLGAVYIATPPGSHLEVTR